MAVSYSTQRVTSVGTLSTLALSIEYFDRSEITVYFDGIITTAWTWAAPTGSIIQFTPGPVPAGVEVLVKRVTDISDVRHNYSMGAQFTYGTLDENFRQILHIAQEATESLTISDLFDDLDMHGYKITNIGTATNPTDAVSLGQYQADALGAHTAKTEAAVSAASALASKNAADASKVAAQAAATSATISEGNAAAYRDTAQVYANTAASAATTANTAKDAAEAAFDSFDDRYLGAKASNPTTDNDGNPLLSGCMYWNSSINEMRIWNGTVWSAAYILEPDMLLKSQNLAGLADTAISRTNLGTVAKAGDTFTGNVNVPSLNGGQLAGMRNKIINGKMEVVQRGTTFTSSTTLGAVTYGIDRWFTAQLVAQSSYLVSRQPTGLSGGLLYGVRCQKLAGGTGGSINYLGQQIEFANFADIAGTTATLSFWAKCGANYSAAAGALTVLAYTGTTADQTASGTINGTWTGQATALLTSVTLTTTYQKFSVQVPIGSAAQSLQILFAETTVGTAGNNDWFEVTGVQLEAGSIATPFEHRPIGLELALCQRYFCKTFPLNVPPATGAGGSGAVFFTGYSVNGFRTTWVFPVEMRSVPLLSTFNPVSANSGWRGSVGGADYPIATSVGIGTRQTDLGVTATTFNGTEIYYIHATASAEL